jgi:23S rRNA G2445 N2-methylase RlmL
MAPDIGALVSALDTTDARAQHAAGQQLLDAGAVAVPALLAALDAPSPQVRKAAAFLLGRAKPAPEVVTALARALGDAEPKVRKNVAITLGTLGSAPAVDALAAALAIEQIGWVRSSLVLALGAIGGAAAHAAIEATEPRDEREREARQKALDRTAPRHARSAWREDVSWRLPLLLDTPPGLERVAVEEAKARGIEGCHVVAPGLLGCALGVAPWQVVPTLRCVYGVLIDGGMAAPLPLDQPDAAAKATRALIGASVALQTISDWLVADGTVRYRFSFKGAGASRTLQRTLLDAVREMCAPLGMSDSPSRYDLELNVASDQEGTRLTIRPSFMPDDRFAYRRKDVGAAINPVIAAGLARLVRSSETAEVFDPVCGSGTLLVERAMLDGRTRLRGRDISATAVGAARANVKAAGFERRIEIGSGDAHDGASWRACDEVLANLPWGNRTRQGHAELPRLYGAITEHLAAHLRPGGRAVLYSASAQVLEAAIARHKSRFAIERRQRIFGGGVWATAFIVRAAS